MLWLTQDGTDENGLLIAVFSPLADEEQIMRSIVLADGVFVRASAPSNFVIAASDAHDFDQRLKTHGALLTYSQNPFGGQLAGCLALATVPFVPAGDFARVGRSTP